MKKHLNHSILVVASDGELLPKHRIWGTGGWVPPENREALDWLTLTRFLGWSVALARPAGAGLDTGSSGCNRCVIIACDPENLTEEAVAGLRSRLFNEPVLIVARASPPDCAFSRLAGTTRSSRELSGQDLCWTGYGPQQKWSCRKPLAANRLEIAEPVGVWSTLDGNPIITALPVGGGVVATLGFHPSRARDTDGSATALLRHLLLWGGEGPVAWLDLERTLVLRMDDPGGAQNVYCRSWRYQKLNEHEWSAMGNKLKQRNGRISLAYVAGWVDDGDDRRGTLKVDGGAVPRVPGKTHPSPLIEYEDRTGHAPGTLYDYLSEFRGIQALRGAGVAEVELHGYTHMHPDAASWAEAPDRYELVSWFRELGEAARAVIAARPLREHPLDLAVDAFHRYFNLQPTTLVCPGDQWTNEVLERALDLGLEMVGSYYLAVREGDRFCWATHVCAPYLNEPDAAWFDSGLPAVGYFHDYEPATEGIGWVDHWLDRWATAGARRLIDYRELAGAVGRRLNIEGDGDAFRLRVASSGAPTLIRPLPVNIRFREGCIPSAVAVWLDGLETSLQIERTGDATGRILVPCAVDTIGSNSVEMW